MLGGLLSAHIIATDEEDVLGMRLDTDGTYNGELLHLARDLGYRLLSAFEASPTRVPYARVSKHIAIVAYATSSTCTAGAGTLLLEFGTLSRLTNETIFEDIARLALSEMWTARSKRNLFGNDYDMEQEKWIHPTSSIGAGVDSIFEYMFKSYVYFGGHKYLRSFEAAYGALLQYSRDTTGGYAFYNVHMRSGEVVSSWVDSLSAFFPGLMVLAGDVDGAESAYMLYYHMWNRFRALPERFNLFAREPDIFYYLLRPEFIESTYYLYRATQDPFYLDVGEMILTDLNALMRTSCGFTAMHDVLTHTLEERMDSFVLSETFKYLYLLFDEENPLHKLDNNFVFTTEGHVLLPLSPVRDGSAQYPRSSSFAKRKLLHSEQPPEFINPELYKIDNIRERLSKLRKSEMFAFPIFPEPNSLGNMSPNSASSKQDRLRRCPVPRAFRLSVRYPQHEVGNSTTGDTQKKEPAKSRLLPVDFAVEWRSSQQQSPLDQLHSMQQLTRALQSQAGHSLLNRPYLLSLHASSNVETMPLRNDFHNVGALVYPPRSVANSTTRDIVMPPVRNGSAVAESALELALGFGGMCSVSSNLFLSRRHEVWKSALASDTDINDVLDIPGDADTWLTPNTRQFSITEYLLSRATSSQAISVDASFQPKGRRGVPLFRDIQMEAPDSSGRMSLEEFYVQQREQLGKSDRLMHAAATSPSHATNAKRRGYFPLPSEKGQQPQRRIVFTNGASQVMTDHVIVRADAAAPKYAQKSIAHRSSGGDASRGEIVSEPTNNRPSASENGAANADAVYNSSTSSIKQSGFHPRWWRPPHDFCHSKRDYAGRLAYFAEMSLYRGGEPFLIPKPTPLTMLHLHGSSAIYGCEEYTPREQRLFAGKVVAVRAGGGCTMWEKAIHAMNGGAGALLVDVAATVDQHNCQQQSGECSAHSAAIGESGSSHISAAQSMTGSAAHRLTDRLQHICAWRTMVDDRCWPEDQYVGTGMYPELRLWSRWLRRRNRDNDSSTSDDTASSHKEGTPYPISMPVVIVDQSVIDEIEGQLAEGRDIQVELLE
ncbi:hypothetical protein GGF47_000091 [Coemansia sp. RSA 2524]|nr:hypothetical protein GGF47_000091 [Coemansia sp. RSA 2524]